MNRVDFIRGKCAIIAFGLLNASLSTGKATSQDDFKMVPAFIVNDIELHRFASNYIGLLRSFSNEWPLDGETPAPNYFVFSETNSIIDGEIVSTQAKNFFGPETWEFLNSQSSSSEWCKVVSVYSTVTQSRETVVFIDESDSTERGRKNCFLASIVNLYDLDVQLSDYFEMQPEVLALDILKEILVKETDGK